MNTAQNICTNPATTKRSDRLPNQQENRIRQHLHLSFFTLLLASIVGISVSLWQTQPLWAANDDSEPSITAAMPMLSNKQSLPLSLVAQ